MTFGNLRRVLKKTDIIPHIHRIVNKVSKPDAKFMNAGGSLTNLPQFIPDAFKYLKTIEDPFTKNDSNRDYLETNVFIRTE